MPDGVALTLALVVLAATLAAAVAHWRPAPEWAVAVAGALMLVVVGVATWDEARDVVRELGPTIGFLAALLVLAEGCRREGLFAYLGAVMASGARGRPRRLLALVFVAAGGVTAVLSLDATVLLLTPVVLATAARLRISERPHAYACTHLANSASLLLPVSNLTNLLAFHASGLSFTRFAGLMVLPTLGAVAIEWVVLSRYFRAELTGEAATPRPDVAEPHLPRFALAVLVATLAGFALSSAIDVAPVWFAAAGALVITAPALLARTTTPRTLWVAAEPGFLIFVFGLGVIVAAASAHGLADAVHAILPNGDGLAALLGVAAIAAVLANVVNNLPATLILVPVAGAAGPIPLLAALLGVNIGPNLTYVGSLATLLWRRVLHADDTAVGPATFLRLGLLTVPAALALATVLLWLSAQVLA